MTGTRPKFSILLPTHNRCDVLGFSIESVLRQTEADFELLVAADGCTDDTLGVVSRFTDPRLRLFDLPKAAGFGYSNRNLVLREARGHYVAFAAHDDLWFPDHLANLGGSLDKTGAEWGYTQPLWVSTDGILLPFFTNLGLTDEFQLFMTNSNTIPAHCVMHTRRLLKEVGYWPENVPEAADWRLWQRMLRATAGKAVYVQQATGLHFSARWRGSRFAGSPDAKMLVDIAEQSAWWPPALRIQVAPGQTEQEAAWTMLLNRPEWVSAVRLAATTVAGRITWMVVRNLLPQLVTARD
jgi:glycosyltransferase involved in cell wall biosynthesis